MTLWEMSIQGGVIILLIVMLRVLFWRRLSANLFLSLWAIAGVRLVFPFRLPDFFNVYTVMEKIGMHNRLSDILPITEDISKKMRVIPDYSLKADRVMDGFFVPLKQASSTINYWQLLWLIGMSIFVLIFAYLYRKAFQTFNHTLPIEKAWIKEWRNRQKLYRHFIIKQSDAIASPLTYGIFRPIILLPEWVCELDTERLNYILTHEYIHICHWDALRKLMMVIILCIHWFNPLVWGMFFLLNRDIELSCDEKVIAIFGQASRSSYAHILLDMEEYKTIYTCLCSNFRKDATEERLVKIMNKQRNTILGMVVSLTLVVSMTTIMAAMKPENIEANTTTGSAIESAVQEKKTEQPTTGKESKEKNTIAIDYQIVMSQVIDDVEVYSKDNGKTWISKEEWLANNPESGQEPEWWTYESYKAWLEKERAELYRLIDMGEKYYDNQSQTWKVWTKEEVEQAIQRYEQQLEEIRQGKWKYSVPQIKEIDENTVYGEGFVMSAPSEEDIAIERTTDISAK